MRKRSACALFAITWLTAGPAAAQEPAGQNIAITRLPDVASAVAAAGTLTAPAYQDKEGDFIKVGPTTIIGRMPLAGDLSVGVGLFAVGRGKPANRDYKPSNPTHIGARHDYHAAIGLNFSF
jgi:hypothetical protein